MLVIGRNVAIVTRAFLFTSCVSIVEAVAAQSAHKMMPSAYKVCRSVLIFLSLRARFDMTRLMSVKEIIASCRSPTLFRNMAGDPPSLVMVLVGISKFGSRGRISLC